MHFNTPLTLNPGESESPPSASSTASSRAFVSVPPPPSRVCPRRCVYIAGAWESFPKIVTASSHFAGQAERSNLKLLSRGEDRSSLTYIISVLLSASENFVKKEFGLSTRIWISVLGGPKFLSRGRAFGTKNAKSATIVAPWRSFTFGVWPLV